MVALDSAPAGACRFPCSLDACSAWEQAAQVFAEQLGTDRVPLESLLARVLSASGGPARIRVTSSVVSGRLASRLMRLSLRNNLNFADRRAFLAGVPRRSGDALPGVAEVGDDLELAAEGTDVVSQGGELGD
jgi:hypothetical protein